MLDMDETPDDVPLRPGAEKFCLFCGSRFTPSSTVGRPPKYCSTAHQEAAAREVKFEQRRTATAAAHEALVAELGERHCEAPGCTNELPAPKLHAPQPPRFCSGACRVRSHRAVKRQRDQDQASS